MSRRKAGPAVFGLATGLCVLLLAVTALADSNVRIVRLSYADGTVLLDRGDGRGFERAITNMPVAHGNRVWARGDSLAELEFEDGDTVRLTPDTLLQLQELSLRSSGDKVSLVEVQEGTAYFDVRHRRRDDFRVIFGRQELVLLRDSRFRIELNRNTARVVVTRGEVEITGDVNHLAVRKGESLSLDLDDPDRYYLARSTEEGQYDRWDDERREYRDRYASSRNYRGYSSYSGYGLSDLNYYGSYFYLAGYGYMWRPYHLGVGWNPYANGAWVYYPGIGYVFVSAYPWGWVPYRYGSWYYLNGYGWCWQPARTWNTWYRIPPVRRRPPGFQQPVPPSEPNGGVINVGQGPTPVSPRPDSGERDARGRKRVAPTVIDNDSLVRVDRSVNDGIRRGDGLTDGSGNPSDPDVAFRSNQPSSPGTSSPSSDPVPAFRPGRILDRDASDNRKSFRVEESPAQSTRQESPNVPSRRTFGRDPATDGIQVERSRSTDRDTPRYAPTPRSSPPPAPSQSSPPSRSFSPAPSASPGSSSSGGGMNKSSGGSTGGAQSSGSSSSTRSSPQR